MRRTSHRRGESPMAFIHETPLLFRWPTEKEGLPKKTLPKKKGEKSGFYCGKGQVL